MPAPTENWTCYICGHSFPPKASPCSVKTARKILHTKEYQLVCSRCAADAQLDNIPVGRLLYQARNFELQIGDGIYENGADALLDEMENGTKRLNKRIAKLLADLKEVTLHQTSLFKGQRHLSKLLSDWLWNTYPERRKRANHAISDRELRCMVFGRDGWKCLACGSGSRLTIDHIVPVVAGGGENLSNLQTLCKPCNSKKGGNNQPLP